MPKLVKNGEYVEDDPWVIIRDEGEVPAVNQACLVSLPAFLKLAEQQERQHDQLGVYLQPGDDPHELAAFVETLPLIAVDFPIFTDGRAFSIARELREGLEYRGELRAIGNFIQDQLFYLRRCGVDAFLVPDDANIESIQHSLNDFSERYQAAVDDPQPLFRRRA